MRVLLLLSLSLAAPALAQTNRGDGSDHVVPLVTDCGPSQGPDAGCDGGRWPVSGHVDDRGVVARIYAAAARGDGVAIAAALDHHVMWTDGAGRLFGRATVAARLLALAPSDALGTDADGHVVTVDTPQGAIGTVWLLLDGLVVSVARTAEPPPTATLPPRRTH